MSAEVKSESQSPRLQSKKRKHSNEPQATAEPSFDAFSYGNDFAASFPQSLAENASEPQLAIPNLPYTSVFEHKRMSQSPEKHMSEFGRFEELASKKIALMSQLEELKEKESEIVKEREAAEKRLGDIKAKALEAKKARLQIEGRIKRMNDLKKLVDDLLD